MKNSAEPAASLTRVLGESERVEDLVEECAQELSIVNDTLKQELKSATPPPDIGNALVQSEAVEDKVQQVAKKLSAVNQALHGEVEERHVLENELAAVTEREESAHRASIHDALTGLPNRKLLGDRLAHGIEQAKRHDRTLAVMFLDLNGFKAINDTHGHDVGDHVLCTVAERLLQNTRGDDTVSRHGGDEFVYLMMETRSEEDIRAIAEKIGAAIRAPFEFYAPGRLIGLTVSASIGVSLYPKDGATAEELISNADKSMYHAKRKATGYSFTP
jgi:diguanylate cyclase (GGDEF)-like protein